MHLNSSIIYRYPSLLHFTCIFYNGAGCLLTMTTIWWLCCLRAAAALSGAILTPIRSVRGFPYSVARCVTMEPLHLCPATSRTTRLLSLVTLHLSQSRDGKLFFTYAPFMLNFSIFSISEWFRRNYGHMNKEFFGTPCMYSLFLATTRMRGADECCPVWGKVETFYCGYCDAAPLLDQDCVWTSTSQHNPSPGH